MSGLRRYTSNDDDNRRWDGFSFRDGDIVISTRSKSGTTWMQMICLLLVYQTAELPAPLGELSPWVDHLVEPISGLMARLDAQTHRRVLKTHTPLDGVPFDEKATYIVVGRHPLDMAVSIYHHSLNIDRARLAALTGIPQSEIELPPLRAYLSKWIEDDSEPHSHLESLPGVLHHLGDAWGRRSAPNVVLVHYADLSRDLDGQMRRLAGRLGFDVPARLWTSLVRAATFAEMSARADLLAPGRDGLFKDNRAFFRRGVSGDGIRALDADDIARYHERATALAPADLLTWLHR